MIECERVAWDLDCFVFYRVISGKYLLYEFNTLMLLLFSEVREEQAHGFLCVPSLLEAAYPNSIEDMIQQFCSQTCSDMLKGVSDVLLATNNCLAPSSTTKKEGGIPYGPRGGG